MLRDEAKKPNIPGRRRRTRAGGDDSKKCLYYKEMQDNLQRRQLVLRGSSTPEVHTRGLRVDGNGEREEAVYEALGTSMQRGRM